MSFVFAGPVAKARRIERGLTRERVAVELGRSAQTIMLWEHGRVSPPIHVVGALADMLDLELTDLIVREAVTSGAA